MGSNSNSPKTGPEWATGLAALASPCFALFGQLLRPASFGAILFLGAAVASAASLFLHVPGITGEQSTPGFPGAMAVQSLDVGPDQFTIVKSIDTASPALMSAVASGTSFPSASALLYNSAPTGPPDGTLRFQNLLATSYQVQGGGMLEQVTFVASNPSSLFLELPGITGESSTPGHAGVIQINSFSLTANQFSIVKPVDSASPAIALAVANGTIFSRSSALFYNSASPSGPPDGIFVFGQVVGSSHQILNGGNVPLERDTFNFANVVQNDTAQAGPTYIINTNDDHNDQVCGADDCTLREALAAGGATKTIQFAPSVTGTITLTGGELSATGNVTIQGPGADRLTVDANQASRVLNCTFTSRISVSGLTLARGAIASNDKASFAEGGCIFNAGNLILTSCVIRDSTATGASTTAGTGPALGGGIFNADEAALSLFNCTLSGNAAVGGSAPFRSSGIAGNVGLGGAIFNEFANNGGSVSITNCTLSGNVAMGGHGSTFVIAGAGGSSKAGAIYNLGSLIILASTITGNSAVGGHGGGGLPPAPDGFGNTGGIYRLNVVGTTASCRSGIIAGNKDDRSDSLGGPPGSNFDFTGPCTSQGFNLIGNADASLGSFAAATDHTGTAAAPLDPKLDPLGLQNNGGPTPTVALQADSIGVNNGAPDAPGRDQRNYLRNGAPDIGAFEFGGAIPVSLGNISTRGPVGIGDEVMIGGFIITGTGDKTVLLRAIGPSLSNPPVSLTGTLQDPNISLFNVSGKLTSNDNWADAPNAQSIDPALRPTNGLESAILISLPPGAYTAIVNGTNGGTGIGLVEVFDLDPSAASKLGNISTRGLVETGDNVMIGGFIVKGPDSEKVVVRAIGPSLANPPFSLTNVLQNPAVSLFDANGMKFDSNDDWRSTQEAEIIATGLQPSIDSESAIVTTLTPGGYTAIVRGVNDTTGIGLVEVYSLD